MKYIITNLIIIFFPSFIFAQFTTQKIFAETNVQSPHDVASVDLDGDGDLDVLFSDQQEFRVGWFENQDGLGGFGKLNIIAENIPNVFAVHAADLDGDGDLEVVTASRGQDKVVWYRNENGQGDFGAEQIISDSLNGALDVYTADLDGDGDLDILSTAIDGDKIVWYENQDGLGDFGEEQMLTETADGARSVITADFDGDGDQDILGASFFDASIIWFENEDGMGNFGMERMVTDSAVGVVMVKVADMDGDNDVDILHVSLSERKIIWYENLDGLGNFGGENLVVQGTAGIRSIEVSDIDGDGDQDVFGIGLYNVGWFENEDGQGDFGNFKNIAQVDDGKVVISGDLDGDGDPDAISTSIGDNKIAWYENEDGMGDFGNQKLVSTLIQTPDNVFAVDLDGDGNRDALFSVAGTPTIYWSKFENGNYLDASVLAYPAGFVNALFAEDLDGDGDQDVLVGSGGSEKLFWYENLDGLGNLSAAKIISNSISSASSVFAIDIDGDGDQDVLSASGGNDRISWYENEDGQGNFANPITISSQADGASFVFAIDMDGDGDIDVLSASTNDDKIAWYENEDGQGDFGAQKIISDNISEASNLYAGDLDGDGDIDVATTILYGDAVVWFRNEDGLGNFSNRINLPGFNIVPKDIFLADVDNDDDLDIITNSIDGVELGWYENQDGLGTFGEIQGIVSNGSATSLFVADAENDGDVDFYITTYQEKVYWVENLFDKPRITGVTYWDANENGIFDADEVPLNNQNVTLNPDALDTWTNQMGQFNFFVNLGDYTLSIQPTPEWTATTATTVNINVDNSVPEIIQNFGLTPSNPLNEIEVDLTAGFMRCNQNVPHWVNVKNIGNEINSGNVTLELDPTVEFVNAVPTPTSIVDNLITWEFQDLLPSYDETFYVVLNLPGVDQLDSTIQLITTGNILDGGNNITFTDTHIYEDVISCAYDPNDKMVTPNIIGEENYTLFTDIFNYTIRFQNTGNDTAFLVTLKDQLDSNLDWTTFRPISSSHPYEVFLDNQGNLEFVFSNILLPDSTTNEEASHGFVKYEILQKPNLPENTIIQNTANIFFDFNPPIQTNTTENILVSTFDADNDGVDFFTDCDDSNPNINPNATEEPYNGLDDDCNPLTLDDDLDEDGFVLADDCDDNNAAINPNATEEPYNGLDDDCNPLTLDDDLDEDGFVLADDCDDNNAAINPNATEEPYNGLDDDCNPLTLDDDLDEDGFVLADDCDDNNAAINPNATEEPYNGLDDDCNPLTLDDDLDEDGFVLADDCDDNNAAINSNATEVPYNGLDDDCNSLTLDDDLDEDGFVFADDCDDMNADINPNAEEIPNNEIDEDCDGNDLMVATQNLQVSPIEIFPNPTEASFEIRFPNPLTTATLEIKNMSGKLVLSKRIDSSDSVDISFLPSGIYLILIQSDQRTWVERVMKL